MPRSSNAEHEVEISLEIPLGPNIIQIFGVCVDAPDNMPYIVMEECEGSLEEHLQHLLRAAVRLVCARAVVDPWKNLLL